MIPIVMMLCMHTFAIRIDSIDRCMQSINLSTYKALESLISKQQYSLLRVSEIPKPSPKASKCTLLSCLAEKHSVLDGEYVNLLHQTEAYTGYNSNASQVWEMLWMIASQDAFLKVALSGIQFSITTHLCAFHKHFLRWYVPNPLLFIKRFKNIYRLKLYLTYMLVRKAVGAISINMNSSEHSEVKLAEIIKAIGSTEINWSYMPEDIDATVRRIDEMINALAGLGCERCRIWGTVQFRGLQVALKIMSGVQTVSARERMFVMNLFMRLSVSLSNGIKMREYTSPRAMNLLLHSKEMALLATSYSLVAFALKLKKRLKRAF
ncbi:putative endoplasmic reticulum oxidoreductin 1 [Ordospora pajunii]|uniref:putative endoplasmic reticulum oxidoreductin 1 n=1 Tax=Ordospora pajunii TaxID=3039483 RepID=UPI0029526B31|nr:putative endoplasmic reticulum oxidoreductin 1 [Ordospora pajunii]KAH9411679.1 putative endoplasmic reticulum oxidoreductin 1 [Ordospora pajunii]